MANNDNDNQDENTDLMKDLPDNELEDLEKTLSDTDGKGNGGQDVDDDTDDEDETYDKDE